MRVLHIISGGDSGGAKTHVFTLLRALKKQITVKVICFTDGVFYQMLADEDIPYGLLMQNSRYDLSVIKGLKRMIEAEGYDLVHAHGARANFIAANLKRHVKVPIMTTMHSDYLMDFKESLYKRVLFTSLNSVSLRFIDYYLAISTDFKKMLIRRHFDPGRIFIAYNGIEFEPPVIHLSRREYLESRGIPMEEGDVFVGILGRFDRVKGLDVLLRAANIVAKKAPEIKFLIAGDGILRLELEKMVQDFEIENNVFFLGFENQANEFLNAIDINTLTSYSESFPYALLEGARMAKATVASRVGGIPDLITDGENGYLFPSGDHAVLAEKILLLAQDPQLRKRFGAALYKTVQNHFTADCMARDHIAVYHKVLQRGRKHKCRQDALLMGYYGFGNSGDEALLNVIISELREADPNLSLVALTSKPKQASEDYAIKAVNRFHIFSVFMNLLRTNLLIYGGGSLIQDVTSSKSLFYYIFVIYLAKLTGTKIMLYGNGVGPIIKEGDRNMVKRVLNHVDVITLRERDSFEELNKMGVTVPRISLTADPAIRVKSSSPERADELLEHYGISRGEPFFVVSIREWKDFKIEDTIVKISDYVSQNYGLKPLYIPLQMSKDMQKSKIACERSKYPAYLIEDNLCANDLVAIVAKAQLVIGMRLHMLIYAANVSVPAIGLVYDPKIKSFMNYAGQDSIVDLEDMDVETLRFFVDDILKNRAQKRAALQENVDRLKVLAAQNSKMAVALMQHDL